MIVCVIEKIDVPGHVYAPGFHEVSSAEFHSLAGIGRVRPATADEVEYVSAAIAREVAATTPPPPGELTLEEQEELGVGPAEPETAEAPPPAETAVARAPRRRRA